MDNTSFDDHYNDRAFNASHHITRNVAPRQWPKSYSVVIRKNVDYGGQGMTVGTDEGYMQYMVMRPYAATNGGFWRDTPGAVRLFQPDRPYVRAIVATRKEANGQDLYVRPMMRNWSWSDCGAF